LYFKSIYTIPVILIQHTKPISSFRFCLLLSHEWSLVLSLSCGTQDKRSLFCRARNPTQKILWSKPSSRLPATEGCTTTETYLGYLGLGTVIQGRGIGFQRFPSWTNVAMISVRLQFNIIQVKEDLRRQTLS
jgi:hypothetical protein